MWLILIWWVCESVILNFFFSMVLTSGCLQVAWAWFNVDCYSTVRDKNVRGRSRPWPARQTRSGGAAQKGNRLAPFRPASHRPFQRRDQAHIPPHYWYSVFRLRHSTFSKQHIIFYVKYFTTWCSYSKIWLIVTVRWWLAYSLIWWRVTHSGKVPNRFNPKLATFRAWRHPLLIVTSWCTRYYI